jgi:hypothetical protein
VRFTRFFDAKIHPKDMADVKTTEIYTHVMDKHIKAVTSPLDSLELI